MDFQYFFPSNGEPTERTATFNSDEEFLKAYFADRQPSMIFTSKNSLRDYELSLADVFPLYFPLGTGSIRGEKRTNAVSDIECLRHYLRLSLPQFQKADFILVVSQMLFRAEAFRSASVRCMSKTVTDGQNLGEKFSMISDSQIINVSHLEHLQSELNLGVVLFWKVALSITLVLISRKSSAKCKIKNHSRVFATVPWEASLAEGRIAYVCNMYYYVCVEKKPLHWRVAVMLYCVRNPEAHEYIRTTVREQRKH
jgi:hypothetical protein